MLFFFNVMLRRAGAERMLNKAKERERSKLNLKSWGVEQKKI